MSADPRPTASIAPQPDAPTGTFDPALDAGLAAAFGPDPTPGGWSQPPLLRDDPSDNAPLVQPSSAEMPRGAGDRYQLLGEIARGGMGVILKGRDPDLGRDLAFKVLKAELAGKPAAEQRFVEEAQVGGQLQHPGVVPVYDLGRFADGRPYFAMKLVKGRTLAELLTARADPSADRGKFLQVFLQVCQTVAYAHSRGVIHRDLKPSNVMVGGFGEVLVMDWGLAKVLPRGGVADELKASVEASARRATGEPTIIHTARSGSGSGSETQAGSVMGTPAFMSPEQAGGEIDKLDERADVFGLGAVLCVVLTGEPPYVANTGEAVRLMAVRGELEDAFARLDACGTDAELVELCKSCLGPRRDARPRHAGEVAGVVAAFLAEVEQRAQRAEIERAAAEARAGEEAKTRRVAEEKGAEERKRRRVQFVLAASLGLLLLGGGAFGWYADRQAGLSRERQAEFETEQARLDGERKAEQAAFDTERRLKAEAAREQVTRLLALATELRKEYRFRQSAAALEQARVAAGAVPDLLPAVEVARTDLDFVVELDAIRGKRSTWIVGEGGKGCFDLAAAPPAYRQAFAARGLDVAADPDAAGDRVTASAVRAEVSAALVDWLFLEPDRAVRDKLFAVLRQADPDSPAAPFRDPAVWAEGARLAKLAAEVNGKDLPPGATVAIAGLLYRHGLDPAPLLRRTLAGHPRDFEVAFMLGQVLMDRPGNAEERIGAYRAALALRPDHYATRINLGHALVEKGDADGAVACHREATRLDPASGQAQYNLGVALGRKGDWRGAVAAYREAIRLDPKYAPAHYNLGVALGASGDRSGEVAAYKDAIKLDPKFAGAYVRLGEVLWESRDLPGAAAAYKEAIRLEPDHAAAHRDLGIVYELLRDLDGAIAEYREVVRLVPQNAFSRSPLGYALLHRNRPGDASEAAVLFQEDLTRDPNSARAHAGLGHALRATGNLDGSLRHLTEAVRLEPRDRSAAEALKAVRQQIADRTAPMPREVKR